MLLAAALLAAVAAPARAANYTDIWWNAAESGWGLTIAHHGEKVFAVWYLYDESVKPLWVVMSDGTMVSPWREDLTRLAEFPNVFCKLSGLVTEANWKQWQPEDFHRYLDIVIEAFGTDRVMIGSDWPVCTLSGDYVSTMRVVAEYVQQFSGKIGDHILGNNCARFYHLENNTTTP